MSVCKITDNIYSVGILNPNLRVFDIVMATDYGTSYNSYIVKGKEKTALVETCHLTYFDAYLENIRSVCRLEEIDYIILNHCEPDHSGALAKLAELIPNATIVVSTAGSIYLKNITNNKDLKVRVAKDGDTLDLGGKELKFISAPMLHWPDSMFTWDKDDKVLFSCDFLGSHYCEPLVFDYNIVYKDAYEKAFKGYYDAIFGPFKPYVLAGLQKMEGLDIEFVANSHGPILTKNGLLEYAKEMYKVWSQPQKNPVKTIPVFYCSAYGNTGKLAEKIKEGILEVYSDARVDVCNIIEHDMAQLSALLNSCDAFAVGSPTINRDAVPPVWVLLSHVDAINNQKKPCLAFGSFGWSGEAVPNIAARLNGLKMKVFGDGYKVCFVPSEEDLQKAKELGREFAQSL
ncbi:FprA family A-type flavoprotein [Candidatus Soleaferrea massiliensis]|uniref:FprA family A-type flavoprotein n=1 Tax=Candidatus Soleaferrea massiliensis TaxID=1470354 RepID=UPI00058F318F|nr:FprA family A-type flavoprotein [Candidatus Soleaferrea massiliensis]